MTRSKEPVEHCHRRTSNSACDTMQSCQMKYLHNYILNTPPDADIEDDTVALRIGSAYHACLEWSLHDAKYFNMDIFHKAITEQKLDKESSYIVMSMVQSYFPLRAASKLKAIAYEVEIGDELVVGYVDMVLIDSNGNWFLSDLKTASSVKDTLFARLAADKQLNLYSYYAEQLAEKCKLDINKFAGCRYNVVVKPKIVIKEGESFQAYGQRVKADIYECFLPKAVLNPVSAYHDVITVRNLAHNITPETAVRNRSSCLDYYKPCGFWSHCHPTKFSEGGAAIIVHSSTRQGSVITSTMTDQTLPLIETDGLLA